MRQGHELKLMRLCLPAELGLMEEKIFGHKMY